jgi:hypothetical protein
MPSSAATSSVVSSRWRPSLRSMTWVSAGGVEVFLADKAVARSGWYEWFLEGMLRRLLILIPEMMNCVILMNKNA